LDNAKQFARDQVYAQKVEGNENLSKTSKILDLFVDQTISDDIFLVMLKNERLVYYQKTKFPLCQNTYRNQSLMKLNICGNITKNLQKQLRKTCVPFL